MDKILVKIILCLNGKLPIAASAIAKELIGSKKINIRGCTQKLKYRLDTLEVDEVINSFMSGNKRLYKLNDSAEILNGTIVLKDNNGEELYTEEKKLFRMVNGEGEVLLSILDE